MPPVTRLNLRHPSFKTTREQSTAAPREQLKKREMLAIFLTILSVLGALLTLLGYGVAISADNLNIGYETLFTSPFELIELSPWALLHIFHKIDAADFAELYCRTLLKMLPGFLIAAMILLVVIAWKSEVSTVIKSRLVKRKLWPFNPPLRRDSNFSLVSKVLVFVGTMSFALPALVIAGLFAVMMLMGFCVMAPSIGMLAGSAHIKDDVLIPAHCAPLKSAAVRLAEPTAHAKKNEVFATCIHVRDGKSIDESGRLVFSTSSAVILFNPATGRASRIPTRDLLIETISHL